MATHVRGRVDEIFDLCLQVDLRPQLQVSQRACLPLYVPHPIHYHEPTHGGYKYGDVV